VGVNIIGCKICRQLTIQFYILFSIILVFEAVFSVMHGQYFYLLVLSVNKSTYILGLICALKYKIHIEKKIITLCIYFCLCNILIRSFFIFHYDIWLTIAVIFLNITNLIWLYNRRKCIKLLIHSLSEKVMQPCLRH